MTVGLVSFICKNKDITYNLSQIERAMREVQGKVDLICFGEAYLQGFDCLCWDYKTDKNVAVDMSTVCIHPALLLRTAEFCTTTDGYQEVGKNTG